MDEQETPGRAGFIEVQKFRQPLLLLLVALVAAPFWYLAAAHFVFGAAVEAAGDLVAVWLFVGVLLPAFLFGIRLVTEVTGAGVRVGFRPFPSRRISFAEIRDVRAVTYRPLREYGGWGLRWGGKGKRAYNVSGNRGVELELVDGRTVMVGSRRPDELAEAVRAHLGRPL